MSKNRKNRKEAAFLRNFTTDIINRMILCDDSIQNKQSIIKEDSFKETLRRITENTNYIIQQLNYIIPRNIPYLSLSIGTELSNSTRLYMRASTEKYINNVILQVDDAMTNFVDITHLLDYYICAGDRSIDSSNIDGLSAEISADSMFKEIVINDIFLDIAYFNSYSFLRNMTTIAKKNFSKMKAEFFYKKKLDSFFDNDPNVVLDYYSFAFSSHNEDDNEFKFDIYKYIQLWDEFIMEYYPNEVHKERKISEQIEMRIDEHIPKDYFTKFANLQQGIYFILRINKKDIPVKKIDYVLSLFNIDNISVGELCIISSEKLIKSYENHFELYDELYIAAFKVVVQ